VVDRPMRKRLNNSAPKCHGRISFIASRALE